MVRRVVLGLLSLVGMAIAVLGAAAPSQAASTDFVTTWKVEAGDLNVTLPLVAGGDYDFRVDWGDGSVSDITGFNADRTHPYAAAGTYTVTISFPNPGSKLVGWAFGNAGDQLKIQTIEQWGGKVNLGNGGHYFSGASNLTSTATDAPDLTGTTNFTFFFFGAAKFNGDLSGWNTSAVTDMSFVFSGAAAFDRDLSAWDTSKVTTMQGMFDGAAQFKANIGGWDTSKVTTMSAMFYNAAAFNQDIGIWNTSAVTDMSYMFNRATTFNQDISGWDTSKVTDLTYMFFLAEAFDRDLSGWDVGSLAGATGMFEESGLTTSNYDKVLVGWSNQPLLNNSVRFGSSTTYSCGAADARAALIADHSWDITDAGETAEGCFRSTWNTQNTSAGSSGDTAVRLPLEALGTYDFVVSWGDGSSDIITAGTQAEVTHTYPVAGEYTIRISGTLRGFRFANAGDLLKIGEISSWGGINFGNGGEYFYGSENLTVTATDAPDLTGTTNFRFFFARAAKFNGDIAGWNTSQVTDMAYMFSNAVAFNRSLAAWDLGNVTNMNGMFQNAVLFNQDLIAWDTSSVVRMEVVFNGAESFNGDVSGWDTSSVRFMEAMFAGAVSFDRDISGWDTGNVEEFESTFWNAKAFNQDLSSWDTGSAVAMQQMFRGASAFDQNLGAWSIPKVATMARMFNESGLTTANYDRTLIGWAGNATLQNGVRLGAEGVTYTCAAVPAHDLLTGTYAWTITDAGVAPCAQTDTSQLAFPNTTVGMSNATTVTLTNPGGQNLAVGSVTLGGADASQFSLGADSCANSSVLPSAGCTIQVSFAPTSTGSKTASLTITSNALTSPTVVVLSGTGVVPGFSVAPESVAFGEVTVGSAGGPQVVVVTNSGAGMLGFGPGAVQVAGNGFALASDACSGKVVPASGTCRVEVVFTPNAAGAATGSLAFASNAPGSPHAVSLTGTGVNPTPPLKPKKQRLSAKLPKRIKRSGLTVITPANAVTNAGQAVRTVVTGRPIRPTIAGQLRYFTVVRGANGKVSVRTFGRTDFRLQVTQRAPAVTGYTAFERRASYIRGVRAR